MLFVLQNFYKNENQFQYQYTQWVAPPKPVKVRTLRQEAEARMIQRNNSFRNRSKR